MFARERAAEIDKHWSEAVAVNGNYFNGSIHLIDQVELAGNALFARLLRTDFKSFLYWRNLGFPDAGVLDGFGSALICASDGAVLLGRQLPGNINSGLAYLPGGFIDDRDVGPDGAILIEASVQREAFEETGLGPAELSQGEGIFASKCGPHISFAIPFQSSLSKTDLSARIAAHIQTTSDPELESVLFVSEADELDGLAIPPFARNLLLTVLR